MAYQDLGRLSLVQYSTNVSGAVYFISRFKYYKVKNHKSYNFFVLRKKNQIDLRKKSHVLLLKIVTLHIYLMPLFQTFYIKDKVTRCVKI